MVTEQQLYCNHQGMVGQSDTSGVLQRINTTSSSGKIRCESVLSIYMQEQHGGMEELFYWTDKRLVESL